MGLLAGISNTYGVHKLASGAMENDGPPNAWPALYDSLSSLFANRSGPAPFRQFYNFAQVTAQQAPLTAVANIFRSLSGNESLSLSQIALLSAFLITMTGGLFSLLKCRRSRSRARKPRSQRSRSTVRKTWTKSSSKTLTSSDDDYEDDEYDSNGSLRHATAPPKKEDWSSQPEQQSSDGKLSLFLKLFEIITNLNH